MRYLPRWKGNTWSWVGLSILTLCALWWLVIGLVMATAPRSITDTIIFGILLSIVPLGLGIYCVIRGKQIEKIRIAKTKTKQNSKAQLPEDGIKYQVLTGLQAIGVDAQIAKRGRAEEKTGEGSLGIIEVSDEPIRWVNVRQTESAEGRVCYHADFGIPDAKLKPDFPELKIRSVRQKKYFLFGQVVDLLWKGKDMDTGIISRLDSDSSIKKLIMESVNVTVYSHRRYRCWTISPERLVIPSPALWDCYKVIARYLLSSLLL